MGFRSYIREFFGAVLELVRPSAAWSFPPAGDFFEAVLLQQPQATEAVLLQQPQATEAVEKGWFSRISEETLDSFLAWFWNLFILQRHGVSPPAGDFFEAVLLQQPQATEAVEKGRFSRISEETLDSFLAWFWNLLVLQRHGRNNFFRQLLLRAAAAGGKHRASEGRTSSKTTPENNLFRQLLLPAAAAVKQLRTAFPPHCGTLSSCNSFTKQATVLFPGSAAGAAALKYNG